MQNFILKMFVRDDQNGSIGKLYAEWLILAETGAQAIASAQKQLDEAGFQQPKDFATLKDGAGTPIREWVRRG